MVALDVAIPLPRRAPEASTGVLPGPSVRSAERADLSRTTELELADAPLLLRLLPGLVRWSQRRDVSAPHTTTLVCERTVDGESRVCGFLVGSRRGVLELLVVDPAVPHGPVQQALLRRFRQVGRHPAPA